MSMAGWSADEIIAWVAQAGADDLPALRRVESRVKAFADVLAREKQSAIQAHEFQVARGHVARRGGQLLAQLPKRRNQHDAADRLSAALGIESVTEAQQIASRWQRIAALDDEKFAAWCELEEPTIAALLTGGAHIGNAGGDPEWYTPAEYVEAARKVMGGIDLDPASCAEADQVIRADRFYSRDDDGLAHAWAGRVWMNPPFAQPAVTDFCTKLVEHYTAGDVTAACLLVNNATETRWFQTIAQHASALCFPAGRVSFWYPNEKGSAPLQGQTVVYFGTAPSVFCDVFGPFGFSAVPA
jgi:hypothetical protein